MALTVQTTSTVDSTDTASVVIPAPSGIVIGDMLVAIVGVGQSASIGSPAGWTQSFVNVNSSGSLDSGVYFYYRVAEAADTSATNYTWTTATLKAGGGAMLRIDGVTWLGDPLFNSFAQDDSFASGATESYTETSSKFAKSLLIMAGAGEGDESSYSNYTITHGAANPTWTELADYTTGSNSEVSFFCAYAVTTDTSNVTAWGFDVATSSSGNPVVAALGFGVFTEPFDSAGTNALLSVSPTQFTQTGSAGTAGTNALHQPDPEFFTQSGKGTSPTVWTNEAKPSTTWTNEQK